MATLSAQESLHMQGLLESIDPTRFDTLLQIWRYLQVSEEMLLDIINHRPPNPEFAGKGHPEFGHMLHYLHTPHVSMMQATENQAVATAAWNLLSSAKKPPSKIAPGFFDGLQATAASWPIVGGDGSLYGFSQYENLDARWLGALVNTAITFAKGKHSFGSTPYTAALTPGADGNIRLGIVGDWGTGAYGENDGPAVAVIQQLAKMNCDYLFHVGDVYYAGTGDAPYVPTDQETGNFTTQWPKGIAPGRSFTLNSNHEMYSGANGYFSLALGGPIFRHQNMTSYFGLTFGKWVILGLDSAYHAAVTSLYMDGVLGDQQAAWIKQFGESIGGFAGKKVLVMTHHQAQDIKGEKLTKLNSEVCAAIGRAPDVWYWGHLHNGIVYSNGSVAGKQNTAGRCVGHSAIPYGVASELRASSGKPIASVDYFSATPSPEGGNRVLNGFATIELRPDGGMTESFYDQGRTDPAWTQ